MADDFKKGDVVSFDEKDSFFPVKGEILDLFEFKGRRYVRIYSFYKRKAILYVLTDGKLADVNKKKRGLKSGKRRNDEIIAYDFDDEKSPGKFKNNLVRFVSIILILIFLFAYIPLEHFFSFYRYEAFLSKKFSLNGLFYAVFARINYRSDFDDFWNTPVTAWNERNGDCEEMASVISDYLDHHGIENHLAGLSIKGSFAGHAVVFAKFEGHYYIIDPTRALEKAGVKKLENITGLKDAVLLYSGLPAYIFKVPEYDGEKKVMFTIE